MISSCCKAEAKEVSTVGSADGSTEGATVLMEGPLGVNAFGWKEMTCRLLRLAVDGEAVGAPVFQCKDPKKDNVHVQLRVGKGSAVDVLPSSLRDNTIVLCTRTEGDARVLLLSAASPDEMERWTDALRQCRGEGLPRVTQGTVQKQATYLMTWRTRYFVLFADVLVYFAGLDRPRKGRFFLANCTATAVPSDRKQFLLRGPGIRHTLCAADADDASRWAQAIMEAASYRDGGGETSGWDGGGIAKSASNNQPGTGVINGVRNPVANGAGANAVGAESGEAEDPNREHATRTLQEAWRKRVRGGETPPERRAFLQQRDAVSKVSRSWRTHKERRQTQVEEGKRLASALKAGVKVSKFDRKGRSRVRLLQLDTEAGALVWHSKKAESLPLASVTSCSTDPAEFPHALKPKLQGLCAVLRGRERDLALVFRSAEDRDRLVRYASLVAKDAISP